MFLNIQWLRAYAAIIVVFHHMGDHYVAAGGRWPLFQFIAQWGFTGVDVFFVISGFIMAHTTMDKDRNWGNALDFLRHRLFRIYLGYWPFFVAAILIVGHSTPQRLTEIDLVHSFFLTNAKDYQILIPAAWSLTYELYFYVIVFASFAIPKKASKYLFQVLFVAIVCRVILWKIPVSRLEFFLSWNFVEFFSGMVIYIYTDYLCKKWILMLSVASALALYGYGVYVNAQNNEIRIFTFGLGSACLVTAFVVAGRLNLFTTGHIAKSVGDASFTLYLSHGLWIGLFYFSGLREALGRQNKIVLEAGFWFSILAIIASSVFLYRVMELPLYRAALGRKK